MPTQTYKMKKVLIGLIVSLLAGSFAAKLIEVPFVYSTEKLSLRLDDSVELKKSQFENSLVNISRMQVFQMSSSSYSQFMPCKENPPEAFFYNFNRISVRDVLDEEYVTYDFAKIKYPHNLIDLAYDSHSIVYTLSSGLTKVYQFDLSKYSFSMGKTIDEQTNPIKKGQILHIGSIFVLITESNVFRIDTINYKKTVLSGYNPTDHFEKAISLGQNNFAVASGEDGIAIYHLKTDSDQLILKGSVTKKTLGLQRLSIIDLAYNSKKRVLFALDEDLGLLIFTVIDQKIKIKNSIVRKKMCKLIYFNEWEDELYLSCQELYRIAFDDQFTFKEKVLPHPEISIKQITSTPSQTAFVGRNIFEIMYMDRLVAIYSDRNLHKLFIDGKSFVSANEYSIAIGKYEIKPPSVTCLNKNASLEGTFNILTKITAACDRPFLKSLNLSTDAILDSDRCIYGIFKEVNLWTPVEANFTLFYICMGVVMALMLGIAAWFVISKMNLEKLHSDVNAYENIKEKTDRFNFKVLNQEQLREEPLEVLPEKNQPQSSGGSLKAVPENIHAIQ